MFKFNQTGYCKFENACSKIHEHEICQLEHCEKRVCKKRHPKICKYFAANICCRFKDTCAFLHLKAADSNIMEIAFSKIK